MNETKKEKLLAGSIGNPPAGTKSKPPLTDGTETREMTLAILNSALQTLVMDERAHIVGRIITKSNGVGTMVLFYGVIPESVNKLRLSNE